MSRLAKRVEEFKSESGRYARRPTVNPERAVKRPVQRTPLWRLYDACDDAYLLEAGGFEAREAWTRACLGNGLEG